MSSRAVLILHSDALRAKAIEWIKRMPVDSRIEFREAKRTLPQNSRMWAMLGDIADQKEHCGRKYQTHIWKAIFMSALGQETVFVPSLDGSGLIPIGHRSSEMSKAEMSELIEFMMSWAAEHGVVFQDKQETAA